MERSAKVALGVVLAVALAVAAAGGAGIGYLLGETSGGGSGASVGADPHAGHRDAAVTWTCAMHPQIRSPKPGKCPICFMDLIPLEGGGEGDGGDEHPRRLAMSEAARKLAEIRTVPVERRLVDAEVRMVGKLDYDERRVKTISAWVSGRIERDFVTYTGASVREGDHLVELYSPDLLQAQEALVQAGQANASLGPRSSDYMRESTGATLEAARDKLRLMGIGAEQIAAVEARGTAEDHLIIPAPMGGVVIHRNVFEGGYTRTGEPMFRIADLSRLWLKLEAYESDLGWIRYGQDVAFSTEAYPGEVFHGTVAFLDPALDPRTRTVTVRVDVDNADGRLRPQMLASAVVRARLDVKGQVVEPSYAGRWICPMHPEIVKDDPGSCDVCSMDLVPAEQYGYTGTPASSDLPLVIPTTAALLTGKRAVVYVEVPKQDRPTFDGREVVLGPRAGSFYIVKEGLEEGERVVLSGAFKIDSALQIQARPSMMSAAVDNIPTLTEPLADALRGVAGAYAALWKTLAGDDEPGALAAAAALGAAADTMAKAPTTGLKPSGAEAWRATLAGLGDAVASVTGATSIQTLRPHLLPLSERLEAALRAFEPVLDAPLRVNHCPMALEDGATWLQPGDDLLNPYFGASMLRCGSEESVLPARASSEGGGR